VSKLFERVYVDVPPAQAARRVVDYLRERGNSDGDTARLPLRLALSLPGRDTPVAFEKNVIATFAPVSQTSDMGSHYRVAWTPEGGGPFPLFGGTLSIGGDEDYQHFSLSLAGDYEPPLGIAGDAFDALAGRFIARATSRDLLGRMRDGIEAAFEADEAHKAHSREAERSAEKTLSH